MDYKMNGNKSIPPAAKVYRPEEEIEHWKTEYLEIKRLISDELEEFAQRSTPGGKQKDQSFRERRREPRYNFMPESKIYAHMGPRAFPILNISIGGIAFHSDMYFEPGTKVLMSALGMIALEVEVLSSDMEETDPDLMEFKYRVRAKFGPHVNGYQVYVLAREMHLQNIKEKHHGSESTGIQGP